MATSQALKGMHNLRTMHTRKKEKDSNYLKLYILDKERTRLRSEQIRLNQRLEIIKDRLNEIDEFYRSVVGKEQTKEETSDKDTEKKEEGGKQWKTMEIDY